MKRLQLTLSLALAACLMLSGCDWLIPVFGEAPELDNDTFYFTQEGGVQETRIRRIDGKNKPPYWEFLEAVKYRTSEHHKWQFLTRKIDTLSNGDIRMYNDSITIASIDGGRILRITLPPNQSDSVHQFLATFITVWGARDDVFTVKIYQDGLKQAARPTTE